MKDLEKLIDEVNGSMSIECMPLTKTQSSDRRSYQGVCSIIRNLKKAGGKEEALEIKQKLFNQYAKRPAFRDELTRV